MTVRQRGRYKEEKKNKRKKIQKLNCKENFLFLFA